MADDDFLKLDIDSFVRWINAVRKPFATMTQLLANSDEKKLLAEVFQLWLVSAILNTAVVTVGGELILKEQIELKDALFYFAFGMLFFLLTVLVFHYSLRALGIRSDFGKTAVLQGVIACYSPITIMFFVPSMLKALTGTLADTGWRTLLECQPDFWTSEYLYRVTAVVRTDFLPGVRHLGWCGPLLSIIFLTLLAEAVCRVYGASKLRAQAATVLSGVLGLAIPGILSLLMR
jgi:hypothetical protein